MLVIKVDERYECVRKETLNLFNESVGKILVIGTLIYLYLEWRKKSEKLLRKNKLWYGDTVIQTQREGSGFKHKIGELIKRDGIPIVRTETSYNGQRLFKWDSSWIKHEEK